MTFQRIVKNGCHKLAEEIPAKPLLHPKLLGILGHFWAHLGTLAASSTGWSSFLTSHSPVTKVESI